MSEKNQDEEEREGMVGIEVASGVQIMGSHGDVLVAMTSFRGGDKLGLFLNAEQTVDMASALLSAASDVIGENAVLEMTLTRAREAARAAKEKEIH